MIERVLRVRQFVSSYIKDYVTQKNTLPSFSKQLAIDMEDFSEIARLLLERDDWNHMTVRPAHQNAPKRRGRNCPRPVLTRDSLGSRSMLPT